MSEETKAKMQGGLKFGLLIGGVQGLVNLSLALLPEYICFSRCSMPVVVAVLGGAAAAGLSAQEDGSEFGQSAIGGAIVGGVSAVVGSVGLLLSLGISFALELSGSTEFSSEYVVGLIVGGVFVSVFAVIGGVLAGQYVTQFGVRAIRKRNLAWRSYPRYIMVFAVGVLALASMSTDFYGSLIAATGDVGGALLPLCIPGTNLISGASATLVSVSVLVQLEKLLRKLDPKWKRWLLSPTLAGALLTIVIVGLHLGWLPFFRESEIASAADAIEAGPVSLFIFYLCGGSSFVVGGPLCWFLLRITDTFVDERR